MAHSYTYALVAETKRPELSWFAPAHRHFRGYAGCGQCRMWSKSPCLTPCRRDRISARVQSRTGPSGNREFRTAIWSPGSPAAVVLSCWCIVYPSFLKDPAQDVAGAFGWVALHAETLHDLGVPLDFVALVQIHGAGQVLEVDHIRQIEVGEPHQGEPAGLGGVATRTERHDLKRDVRLLGRRDQPLDLAPHDGGAAHRAAQHRLVQDHPQMRWRGPAEQPLPVHPQADPVLDLLRRGAALAQLDDSPRVVRGLQQAGDELKLVEADER